jgi:4-amino-4-deoxy-L-arabinose transferase-like glycosyltransferase
MNRDWRVQLRKPVIWVVIIAVLAMFTRLFAMSLVGLDAPPQNDGIRYDLLAQSLLAGQGYSLDGSPTAFVVPGYPAFLATIYFLFGYVYAIVRLIQALLGALTAVLGYIWADQVYGRRVGLLVGLGLSIYPVSVYTATVFYSENLFLPLFMGLNVLLLWITKRPTWTVLVLCGLVFGLVSLVRPNMFAFLPFVFIWACTLFPIKRGIKYASVIVGIALCLILPWVVRNSVSFGSPVGVTTGVGTVLWQGNNSFADGGGMVPSAKLWNGDDPPDRGLDGWSDLSEPESDQRFRLKAQEWIIQNPDKFLVLVPVRIYHFWAPNYLSIRGELKIPWFFLALYWLAIAVSVIAAICYIANWRLQFAAYLFIAFFTFGTGVSIGSTRYSLHLIPFLLAWGGLAFWWCFDKLQNKFAASRAK